MFRYREFRSACKNGENSLVLEALQKCLEFEDYESYFKACSYISELINQDNFKLDRELLNLLYNYKILNDLKFDPPAKSRRIGVFVKHSEFFQIELLSSINRVYLTPVVILIGETLENIKFSESLATLDIVYRFVEPEIEIEKQVTGFSKVIKEENISSIILHANPADLDFLILARSYPAKTITYHRKIPLLANHTYCEQEDSLGKGSWERNIGLPIFERYSAIYLPEGEKFPVQALNFVKDFKILLLNNDPISCLEGLDEQQIQQILFVSDPNEYHDGLKYSKELLLTESNFKESLDLSLKYGLSLRYLEDSKSLTYAEVKDKYDLKTKFTTVLANLFQTKTSFRKKLPRIIFFRNDSAAPVIGSINRNISAALRHARCPVFDIDISPMVSASRRKDWESLKEIQQNVMDQIAHFCPDAALGYNTAGIFPNGDSHILEKKNIPYYGLFFDNPFYFMNILKTCKNKSLTKILTLDKHFIDPLKQDGFSETYYFPIATSMHHNPLKNTQEFNSESFLFTSTIKAVRSGHEVGQELKNKSDQDFINYAFTKILDEEHFEQNSILGNYPHFYSKDFKDFQNDIWFRIDNQCSSQLRIKTIEALKDFPVEIYGGGNWNKIELAEKHHFHGRLNYKLLHEAIRQSFATVCRTPLNIQNGIQQRILDCAAARGLILTDYRPILEEHFELDKELFVYRNNEELKEKADFLIKNPKTSKKAVTLLQKKVLEEHTWDVRIQELINLMLV